MKLVKTLLSVSAVAACSLVAWTAVTQQAGGPPTMEVSEHHRVLEQMVGKWDATMSMMGAESKGEYEVKLGPGGLWTVEDFKGDFGGMSFSGHGVNGYDPSKKKYVGIWVDSMTTSLTTFEGTYDKAKNCLTFDVTTKDPSGTEMRQIHRTTFRSKDAMTFEMLMPQDDGTEMAMMTIEYTRKK